MRKYILCRVGAQVLGLVCALATPAHGAELKPKTIEAFDRYVRATETRMREELQSGKPYLWVDGLPQKKGESEYAELRKDEIVIQRMETEEDGASIKVPDGLVHHWVGVVYVPGASLEQTLAVLQDYDNHAKTYKPEVRQSKLLHRNGNEFRIYLQLFKKSMRTVAMNAEFDVRYFRLNASRTHSRSYSTRIAEIENLDKPDEREYPPGKDHGYLWRLYSYWRCEEKDGGTYVQLEYIALSRSVPSGFGWLLNPLVRRISRESILSLLNATRKALTEKRAVAERVREVPPRHR